MRKRITASLHAAADLFTAPSVGVLGGLAMVWYGLALWAAPVAWVVVGAAVVFMVIPASRFIR